MKGSRSFGRGEKGRTYVLTHQDRFCCVERMPRALRIEYPGAIYHVLSRGGRREEIFRDEEDWSRFINTLQQTCEKTGWEVHAWCLKV
jgi:hypothetical protein